MKRIGLIVLSVLLVWSMLCIPAVADPAETPEPQLEVSFSQESAVRGETITADIILHNNPGIAAINFHIGHDAELKLTEYAGFQLTDWVVGVNEGENAVWVNSKTFTGDGSILKLVFQVSEAIPNTADVKLTVSAEGLKTYDLNENEVYFTVKPATISIPPVPKGVTVGGTVTSYGEASEKVTVTLTPASGGTSLPATLTSATGTAPYSQNYTFAAVPAGDYTLKVTKKGHAPWTENITVSNSNVTGKNVAVYLIGDVNGDGDVTGKDKILLYRYLAEWENAASTIVSMEAADINQDGIVTGKDKILLTRYLSEWSGSEIYFQ